MGPSLRDCFRRSQSEVSRSQSEEISDLRARVAKLGENLNQKSDNDIEENVRKINDEFKRIRIENRDNKGGYKTGETYKAFFQRGESIEEMLATAKNELF